MDYLAATAIALGAAVLHNFLWHRRWTWADRVTSRTDAIPGFLRFALANGAVSLGGNVIAMVLLVDGAGVHPVPASAVAIAACGLANFWVGDRWCFAPTRSSAP